MDRLDRIWRDFLRNHELPEKEEHVMTLREQIETEGEAQLQEARSRNQQRAYAFFKKPPTRMYGDCIAVWSDEGLCARYEGDGIWTVGVTDADSGTDNPVLFLGEQTRSLEGAMWIWYKHFHKNEAYYGKLD